MDRSGLVWTSCIYFSSAADCRLTRVVIAGLLVYNHTMNQELEKLRTRIRALNSQEQQQLMTSADLSSRTISVLAVMLILLGFITGSIIMWIIAGIAVPVLARVATVADWVRDHCRDLLKRSDK